MSCDSCPDYIKATVRAPVRQALEQVRAINRLIRFLNDAVDQIADEVIDKVGAIVDAIPLPPVFDLSEIIGLLTCPLTPLAMFLDPDVAEDVLEKLDPREIFERLQDTWKDYLADITEDYENALRELQEWNLVNPVKRFFDDLRRLGLDEVTLLKAAGISAYVKAVCEDEYTAGPYDEFVDEATSISLIGFVPTDLNDELYRLMLKLQEAEAKFAAWRALIVAPVPF